MSEKLERLRAMTKEELIAIHDKVASHTQVGTAQYLSEIARRDDQERTEAMLRLTRWITAMTLIVTVTTIVNVILVVLSVAR